MTCLKYIVLFVVPFFLSVAIEESSVDVDIPGEFINKIVPSDLHVALCQLSVSSDKSENIKNAHQCIQKAVEDGAEMVVLPECWNSPYDTSLFRVYAESITNGPSVHMMRQVALEKQVWIIGGTIPEIDESSSKIYNTCVVLRPDGTIETIHRKMHLFDIDVVGAITFKESDTLSAGNQITTFPTPFGVVGVGICYDLRFPELSLLMRSRGASILIFPSAFSATTGKAHWDILARARAVDTQSFVLMASPARSVSGYQAWGHSLVVDPWGVVLGEADETPATIHATLTLDRVAEVRQSIPVSIQRRSDIYALTEVYSTNTYVSRLQEEV